MRLPNSGPYQTQRLQLPLGTFHWIPLRTVPDPNFPGEDEVLFFVMVELNLDDIRELKRVTALEMQGSLDSDGLRAFVEALRLQ